VPTPLVVCESVSKRFGATVALNDVDLELHGGEVHVIAGQNGAGKSTLIKILSGVHQPDEGEIRVGGEAIQLADPLAARRAGIATIHQELSLVDAMSVGDNLLLGDPGSAWAWLRRGERRERALALLRNLDLDVDPDRPLDELPLATRQLVEIARALGSGSRVIVMDEPTSALAEEDAERLFAQVEALTDRGCAVVYISHRMEELERLADRITVLRDGEVVASEEADSMTPQALVRHMVGRDVAALAERGAGPADSEIVLEVGDLRADRGGSALAGVGLSLRAGEIVGVVGLQGSGVSLLPRALYGAIPSQGRVTLHGQMLEPPTPGRCLAGGMAFISGDRAEALVGTASLLDNATLSSLSQFSIGPWLRAQPRAKATESALAQMKVVHAGIDAPVSTLSGGNQQKVALARAMIAEPRVLLLDEPTRGVDVGAKRDVHDALQKLAAQGRAILIVSSDLDEIVALAHRAIVIVDGAIGATLAGDGLTRGELLAAAMGQGRT
jgi:ABC-type sugar transport system ATPase subunit